MSRKKTDDEVLGFIIVGLLIMFMAAKVVEMVVDVVQSALETLKEVAYFTGIVLVCIVSLCLLIHIFWKIRQAILGRSLRKKMQAQITLFLGNPGNPDSEPLWDETLRLGEMPVQGDHT